VASGGRRDDVLMGELIVYSDGQATIMGGELDEPQEIVIYCDLCNEPIAITPAPNDTVFLQCLKCHAVNAKPAS
jgi:hypothetical protein